MSDVLGASVATGLLFGWLSAWPRLAAWLLRRADPSQRWLEQWVSLLFLSSSGTALLGSVLIVWTFDPAAGLREAVGSPVALAVANGLLLAGIAVLGLWIARSHHETLTALAGAEAPVPPALERRLWLARVGCVSLVAIASALVLFDVVGITPRWVPVVGILVWFGVYFPATLPLRIATGSQFRLQLPSEAERERIEAAYERFGRDPGQILVHPDPGVKEVYVAGRGDAKRVVVSRPFLERADDDALAVALAQVDQMAQVRFTESFFGVLALGALGALGLLDWLLPTGGSTWGLNVFIGGVVVTLAGVQLLRRSMLRADGFAVEQFGPDRVDSVYREFLGDISPGRSRAPSSRLGGLLTRVVSPVPSVDRRFQVLEAARSAG